MKNYMLCIEDLFNNYIDILAPFLNNTDKQNYIEQKLKLYLNISFHHRHYKTFLQLYFLSLRFMPPGRMTRFVARLLRRKLVKGEYNV